MTITQPFYFTPLLNRRDIYDKILLYILKEGGMFIMVKTNLKTLAYNTIKQKIVTCEYAPGTFLNEEILTDELKISRTPIRDALSRLEQEGLIEIKPKKGITVTALSIKDVNMILRYGNYMSLIS